MASASVSVSKRVEVVDAIKTIVAAFPSGVKISSVTLRYGDLVTATTADGEQIELNIVCC